MKPSAQTNCTPLSLLNAASKEGALSHLLGLALVFVEADGPAVTWSCIEDGLESSGRAGALF